MAQLVLYELKKILRRPLTLVVTAGCLAAMLFMAFNILRYQSLLPVWAAALDDDLLAKSEDAADLYGEGIVVLHGRAAIEQQRRWAQRFAGEWDDARLQGLVEEYVAFRDDPLNYTDELDAGAMMVRGWALQAQGLTDAQIEEFNQTYPLYIMDDDKRYAEWQQWDEVYPLMEALSGLNAPTLADISPLLPQGVGYQFHLPAQRMMDLLLTLFGIFLALMVLAGLSPIFCEEVVRGTEPVLLAARHGRKRLVWAKLLAGGIFTLLGAVALVATGMLTVGLYAGWDGMLAPVQLDSLNSHIPFEASYLTMMLLHTGYQLAGMLAFAALVLVLSSRFSSPFPTLFTGTAIFVLGLLLAVYAPEPLNILCQLLPPGMLFSSVALNYGYGIGLGGLWVPQWLAALVVAALILAGGVGLVAARYRKKRG